ncbi:MAG: RNA methyltransferase [Proteobacteria bacterium]|nr:RNA methyltransferase [Pseudomonadota bacterium]
MARDERGRSHGSEPAQGSHRTITSLQNDSVKLVRSLEMRKARRETGLFVAEGASVLLTARDNGWSPRMLVTGPGAAEGAGRALEAWAIAAAADRLEVSAAVLEKLAAKDNPQSAMGVFEQRWATLPRAADVVPTKALWVVLEEIRDPGNLGTILRTVDAAGAAGVILAGQTCDPYSREAVRASMGSIFAVPVARASVDEVAALARGWPGDVVATHLKGRLDYREAAYREPVLLVMGNEGAGLSDEMAAVANKLVRIPMAGRLDSLNLAIATALMLYEIQRTRLAL